MVSRGNVAYVQPPLPLKKIGERDVQTYRATLKFLENFKVALSPLHRIFLNFAKSCILPSLSQFDNDHEWGSLRSFLSYQHLRLKLRVFLVGHFVIMVTCDIERMTAPCLTMTGHLYDTTISIVASLFLIVVVFIL